MVKRSRRRGRVLVSADGTNVVSHVGARLLSDLADAVGLTGGWSAAMSPTKQRRRGHDRGEVLVDLAVIIADGGDAISDLVVLRNQPELFDEVASTPTTWRNLEAVDTAALARIATVRAPARRRVWAARADPGFNVIDIDATLIPAHSEKQDAAPTYKRGFGHHRLLAFLDATGEALAGILRHGPRAVADRPDPGRGGGPSGLGRSAPGPPASARPRSNVSSPSPTSQRPGTHAGLNPDRISPPSLRGPGTWPKRDAATPRRRRHGPNPPRPGGVNRRVRQRSRPVPAHLHYLGL